MDDSWSGEALWWFADANILERNFPELQSSANCIAPGLFEQSHHERAANASNLLRTTDGVKR